MIFSLFWEGAFIRGGAFILKSEILGGRLFEGEHLFEAGRLVEEIWYSKMLSFSLVAETLTGLTTIALRAKISLPQ